MTPTDPLYASQWHFSLIGNIQRIWDEYNGTGIQVGVYDDGVDFNHADLNDNYVAGLQVLDNLGNVVDAFPDLAGDAHGTACAGLIGAEANNGAGGVGVAWGVDLTGVNIFGAGTYGDVNGSLANFLAVVNQAASRFDISSNSWGSTPVYDLAGQSLNGTGFANQVSAAYGVLSSTGRGGLGTIITQAAGNDALDGNGDGVNASRHTITVAAAIQSGSIADYSNFGACILVAAPAASVTTDVSGANGYNATDYASDFGGTSAATPVVSGVIALMLDANEGLGWRDVQNILANSASRTGSVLGGAASGFEVGAWAINRADNWNGGGMHIHTNYGYGMVNAFNAVRMAEVWNLFTPAQTSANEQTASSATVNLGGLTVPDNNATGVSFNISMGTNLQIEHAQLVLNFTHTYVGDLKVTLTSAEGTQIVVALNSNTNTSFNGTWTYGIDHLRGELSAGTWTVRVSDLVGGDIGALNSASLKVFGTALNANDVFHFTDEFLTIKALDASRGVITDTDGGVDWLNFAAIVPNVLVNMNSGQGFSVGGVTWGTLGAATVIENAIGGDGNDGLFGNASNNTLYGMRGNDALVGYGANDIIFGGAGNDTLLMDDYGNVAATNGIDYGYGDAGDDLLWGYGGNDTLFGGEGADALVGNTFLVSVAGFDSLYGGNGVDSLFVGDSGNAYLDGGAGADSFFAGTNSDTLRGGAGSDYLYGNTGADFFLFYSTDFAANDADIVYFMNAGDRLKFSSALNGTLVFQDIASLQYDSNPAHLTTGVYITAFLAGGAEAHITVYGMTVASLASAVDYTL